MRYTNVTSETGSPLLHPHALQLVCLPRYTLGLPQLTQRCRPWTYLQNGWYDGCVRASGCDLVGCGPQLWIAGH